MRRPNMPPIERLARSLCQDDGRDDEGFRDGVPAWCFYVERADAIMAEQAKMHGPWKPFDASMFIRMLKDALGAPHR